MKDGKIGTSTLVVLALKESMMAMSVWEDERWVEKVKVVLIVGIGVRACQGVDCDEL